MALAKARHGEKKTVWVCSDTWFHTGTSPASYAGMFQGYSKGASETAYIIRQIFKKFLLDADSNCDYCAIRILDQVMRCPDNVYEAAYDSFAVYQLPVKPFLGHKIEGAACVRIRLRCDKKEDCMEKTWIEIHKILQKLTLEKMNLDNVAIISTYLLTDFFFEKCETHSIPAKFWVDECELHSVLDDRQEPSDCCSSRTSPPSFYKGELTIMHVEDASSKEWPIVILAAGEHEKKRDSAYGCKYLYFYRARTRATAMLIEIIALDASWLKKLEQNRSEWNLLGTQAGLSNRLVRSAVYELL